MEHARGGELDVNRTTVDRDVQLKMWNDWRLFVSGLAPRPNHGRAIHPDESWHCLPRARAVDTDDDEWIRNHPEFGWRFVVRDEKWHAQYYPELDEYKGTGMPVQNGSEEMIIQIKGRAGVRSGGLYLFANGKRVFLGAHAGKGFPLISDEGEINRLFSLYK